MAVDLSTHMHPQVPWAQPRLLVGSKLPLIGVTFPSSTAASTILQPSCGAVVGGLAPPPAEEEERREIEAQQQVIFVLESAQLEVAQVGKVCVAAGSASSTCCCQQ